MFAVDLNLEAANETRGIIEGEGGTCATHACWPPFKSFFHRVFPVAESNACKNEPSPSWLLCK